MSTYMRPLLLASLLLTHLIACGASEDPTCTASFELCPEGYEPVSACAAGAQCLTQESCGDQQICQRSGDINNCLASPVCAPDEVEVARCGADTPCAGGCLGEPGCRSESLCGETVYCSSPVCNPEEACPGFSFAVDVCPDGYICEQIRACDTTVICQSYMSMCAEPPSCPPDTIRVRGCRDNGRACRELAVCDTILNCEELPTQCLAEPVCPPNATQVDVCPDDAYCFPQTECGRTILCELDGGACAPQDAVGVGDCRRLIGTRWDGAECVTIGGCECAGADCDALYQDPDTCKLEHEQCR